MRSTKGVSIAIEVVVVLAIVVTVLVLVTSFLLGGFQESGGTIINIQSETSTVAEEIDVGGKLAQITNIYGTDEESNGGG